MMEYASLIPHSPLLCLSITKKHSLPPKTNASFDAIAEELKTRGIHHIVTIGSHPKFERESFSTYIASEYEVSFPEFGDLVTSIPIQPWFKGITRLRESVHTPPMEVLSHSQLDYHHGIPLLHLSRRFTSPAGFSVLPINDSIENESISDEIRYLFGKSLRNALDSLDVPYAVICTGDLYATMEQTHSKSIHQANKKMKQSIEADLDFTLDGSLNEVQAIKPPTLSHTLPILRGMIGDTPFSLKEFSFESINQTSFFFGGIDIVQG